MKRYSQWALILILALAVTVLLAPGGVANGNDDDDNGEGNDDCPGNSCHDNDDGDDDEDGEDDCGCPGASEEFLVGNFTCAGGTPDLTFNGSSGIGMFHITGSPVADPNSCADLGAALETAATDEDCTSAGLVLDPALALTVICTGDRDDLVEVQGDMISAVLTFAPSTPLVMQVPTSSTTLNSLGRVGRRR